MRSDGLYPVNKDGARNNDPSRKGGLSLHIIFAFALLVTISMIAVAANNEPPTCNSDGVCDPGEDWTSCPNDCLCGNGMCDIGEDSGSCPGDCYCGDGMCDNAFEDWFSCPGDCPPPCNSDGVCDPGEDWTSCPSDCMCGNGMCDEGEDSWSCPSDCYCGDGMCDAGEDWSSCSIDCSPECDSNGECNPGIGEDPWNCYGDCHCGDGACDAGAGEDWSTCPSDGCTCGNGVCDPEEAEWNCPGDCYCGNGICDQGEDSESCLIDCPLMLQCGDPLNAADTTYTLTQDVASEGTCFTIGAENVTLDCDGHTINYSQFSIGSAGVDVNGYSFATIRNCNLVQGGPGLDNPYGVLLNPGSDNSTIENNTVTSTNGFCISLSSSSGSTIRNNVLTSTDGYGITLSDGSSSNIINDNSIDATGTDVGSNIAGVYIESNSNGNNATGNNVTVTDGFGVYITDNAMGNSFASNNVTATGSNVAGLYLESGSTNNTFTNNTVTSAFGVYIISCTDNTFTGNNVTGNDAGFYFEFSSDYNTLAGNIIDSAYAIYSYSSSENMIYNNLINGSTQVVLESAGANTWNTTLACDVPGVTNIMGGPCIGGNFWATPDGNGWSEDPTQCGTDSSGICNSSYIYDESNVDYLPLAMLSEIPPIMMITSPSDGTSLTSRTMTVNGTATDTDLDYTNISIYQEANLIDSTTSSLASWSVSLSVAADGTYTINATTYDLGGHNASSSISVTVSTPTSTPQVSYATTPSCFPNWMCGSWSECGVLGSQSRTCTDTNLCGASTGKPLESQICSTVTSVCEPSWVCADYGACNPDGTQSRTCADSSLCGSNAGKPDVNRGCTYILPTLRTGLSESDNKVVSDTQSILAEADAAISAGDYTTAAMMLSDVITNAENIMTSDVNAPAAQSMLMGAVSSANQLIANGASATGAEVLAKVSEAAGFLAARDSSAASPLIGAVLDGTNALISANQLDDAAKVLTAAKGSTTTIAETNGEIVDELESEGIDAGMALGLDALGMVTPDLRQIRDRDTQINGILIQSASADDAERKQMLSQASSLIKEMLDAAPEIKRFTTTTTITTGAGMVSSIRAQTTSEQVNALLDTMESNIAAGGEVEIERSLSVFRVTNVEKNSIEINRSLVILKVNPLTRMNNLTIVESIPKSVAESADDIVFPGIVPTVLVNDPMLSWTFDTAPIGTSKQASYVLNRIVDSVDSSTAAAGEIVPFSPLAPEVIVPEAQNMTLRDLGERAIITILVLLAIFVYMRQRRRDETPSAPKGKKGKRPASLKASRTRDTEPHRRSAA